MDQQQENSARVDGLLSEVATIFMRRGTPIRPFNNGQTRGFCSDPDMFHELRVTLETVSPGPSSGRREQIITITYNRSILEEEDGRYRMTRHAVHLTHNVTRRLWSHRLVTGKENTPSDILKLAGIYGVSPDLTEGITPEYAFRIIRNIAEQADRRIMKSA